MESTLEMLRTGDRAAWKDAIDRLFNVARQVLRTSRISEEDIKDIAIESITKVVKKYLATVETFEALELVVARAALNAYKDWLDKHYTIKRGAGAIESLEAQLPGTEYESSVPTPAQIVERMEFDLSVEQALRQIPEHLRKCISDHFIFGLSYGEIAKKYNISIGNVGIRISRGKKALQPIFIKMGLIETTSEFTRE